MPLPHHRSSERSPGARGRAFGRACRDRVGNTVAVYERLLREAAGLGPADLVAHGEHVGVTVARRWPDLVDEVVGIADGAGVHAETLLAINARTELLGARAAHECSLAGATAAGGATLAQTWDWHPALAPSRVVWSVAQGGGRGFTTVTEAGLLAKLGLSSAGLACGLNFLTCDLDGGSDRVPVHVLLRVVLDRCDSATAALELLLGTPVRASSAVTLAAHDGTLVAVELSPGGAGLAWPDGDGRLVHTNHFLAGPPAGIDTQPHEQPGTLLRRAHLAAMLARGVPAEQALAAHVPAPRSLCLHEDGRDAWPDRRATLLAVALDPGAGTLRVAAGPPCESPFEAVTPAW